MNALLGWEQVVFLVPLGAGVVLAVGAALGGFQDGADAGGDDVDADGDADGDAEAEADGDADPDGHTHALQAGRVPLMVRLMMGCLVFGSAGFSLLAALGDWQPRVLGVAGVGVASAALAATLGRVLARAMWRWVPLQQTARVRRSDLVGRLGVLVLPAGPGGGLAHVKDHEGNLHQVRVCTRDEQLARGVEVVVLEQQPEGHAFVVTALQD